MMSKNWVAPPYYWVWSGMKGRCYNPEAKAFGDYGGRGIKVCDRWKDSFQAFADDMGKRPDGCTLDRIDNDGDYTPENCRWANRKTQQRNRRCTVYVTIGGTRYLAIELAESAGVPFQTIVARAKRGMTYDQVTSKGQFRDLSGLKLGGRASGAVKLASTHCKYGHERTPENVLYTKQGWRTCRVCHNAKMRRLNAAKRAVDHG